MAAEIISIGTELTTGAKLDTNCQWLSLELAAAGIPVVYHTTVADDLEANTAVFRQAIDRCEVVLVTGGLGPTLDDLTREALAQVLDVPLELHPPSLDTIRAMFARRQRVMPERNVVQAMVPRGSVPIPNPRGTAPGIYLEIPRGARGVCRLAAMPGVPSEMKGMFHDWVLPKITQGHVARQVIRQERIHCFGLGESAAEELLGDVTARSRDPEVGITVHEATITLRIVAHAATEQAARDKIEATRQIIRQRMGDYVFGEEDEELEHVVARALAERGQTLAVAESATGGLLAHRLTDAAETGRGFAGGLVVDESRGLPALSGWRGSAAASPQAVRELALSCRDRFQSDFALAVSARSHGVDTETSPEAPRVWIALADRDGVRARELNVAGDPAIAKSRIAKSALNLVRLKLLGRPLADDPEAR